MGKILVKRAIDRSKYPKTMMYVDREGNICAQEKRQPLSPEEKAKRQAARDEKRNAYLAEGKKIRDAYFVAKKKAQKEPSVANAEALEEAKEVYDSFKEGA